MAVDLPLLSSVRQTSNKYISIAWTNLAQRKHEVQNRNKVQRGGVVFDLQIRVGSGWRVQHVDRASDATIQGSEFARHYLSFVCSILSDRRLIVEFDTTHVFPTRLPFSHDLRVLKNKYDEPTAYSQDAQTTHPLNYSNKEQNILIRFPAP